MSVEPADTAEQAAEDADVLITTTPATSPLVTEAMLHPGLHITAVGSDAETKQELAADVVSAADVFACDSVAQSQRLGELRAAVDSGYDPDDAVELGMVIAGEAPGRGSPEDVTICDLTGTGAQDTAIASLAVSKCAAAGSGVEIET
jgi:ornithine cyclodeaminase